MWIFLSVAIVATMGIKLILELIKVRGLSVRAVLRRPVFMIPKSLRNGFVGMKLRCLRIRLMQTAGGNGSFETWACIVVYWTGPIGTERCRIVKRSGIKKESSRRRGRTCICSFQKPLYHRVRPVRRPDGYVTRAHNEVHFIFICMIYNVRRRLARILV